MNEYTYAAPQSGVTEELNRALAAQAGGLPQTATSDELAQKILVGMQQGIEAQIDWRLQQRKGAPKQISGEEVGLILGTIGLAVPLTAIAGALAGLPAIGAVWIGLILIHIAWASRR